MLTDSQIDRYSRQIILPEIGGRGQERLLGSALWLLGEPDDLRPALAYLAGAGVGALMLQTPAPAAARTLARELAALNADVRIAPTDLFRQPSGGSTRSDPSPAQQPGLILAGSNPVLDLARRLEHMGGARPMIFARLAEPLLLARLPSRPPCPACLHPALFRPIAQPAPDGALIAMAAVVQVIQGLLGGWGTIATTTAFHGYETIAIPPASEPACPVCG